MATDLAEILDGTVGLSLLFGTSLMTSLAIAGGVTSAILSLPNQGCRKIES